MLQRPWIHIWSKIPVSIQQNTDYLQAAKFQREMSILVSAFTLFSNNLAKQTKINLIYMKLRVGIIKAIFFWLL